VFSLVPCGKELSAAVADLDHKLVEAYVEISISVFDPTLIGGRVTGALVRKSWATDAEKPKGNSLRLYAGHQEMVLSPSTPVVKWTFRPRPGDRVDSLDAASPALALVFSAGIVYLRPPSGDPLSELPAEFFSVRVGAAYMVRDRSGLLF